jgi:hypothetical protein
MDDSDPAGAAADAEVAAAFGDAAGATDIVAPPTVVAAATAAVFHGGTTVGDADIDSAVGCGHIVRKSASMAEAQAMVR